MTPERWQQMKQLFQAALNRSPGERDVFLAKTCWANDSLRRDVEILLDSHNKAEGFLEAPAACEVARLIMDEHRFAQGQHIDRYEILAPLGAGGMGEVYQARDTNLGRDIAIKVLPPLSTADPDLLRRFKQEAFTASALNHPNILTVFEFGEVDSQPFIATEYVDGITLRSRLKLSGLTIHETLEIAGQLASALAAAHKAGVIHRDVKPENIMIRHEDGIVKMLDFGLAKATEKPSGQLSAQAPEAVTRTRVNTSPGVVMGTASYMSPEQARGLTLDERTDIWSLGVVIYEMVAGRLPFEGPTTSDVVAMILQKEPTALTRLSRDADERLDEIVTKALAKDREDRYQVARDMLIDLKRLKQHLDFETEIDRTSAPESRNTTEAAERTSIQVGEQSTDETAAASNTASTSISSAEYIITEIKRHRRGFVLTLAGILTLVAVATVSYWWLGHGRPPALTDKDTLLIADFVNTTGDQVFDGALKQALAVQLGQSPFLNIFSDDRVRDSLRFMGRSPDERVTREVAREICLRHGLKVLFAGSVSSLGSHYVITLEAINAQTGDTIARAQEEAENKEQVLKKLGEAATNLREKLGESLASIQKFDAIIEQATTSSLAALKAYSLGRELTLKGKVEDAIPLFKRTIELDPNFALGYNALANVYNITLREDLAIETSQKAFDLRNRASEYEKLKITADYYAIATGEIEKSIEAMQSLTLMYPRDYVTLASLAGAHISIGQFEKAVEEFKEAIRLNPNAPRYYGGLAFALRCLNRFDEAKEVYEQAIEKKFDLVSFHVGLYGIAFMRGDTAVMRKELELVKSKSEEPDGLEAVMAWYLGRMRQGSELWNRVADSRIGLNKKELAADVIASNAWRAAVFGNCPQAREDIARASVLPTNFHSLLRFGITYALCGEAGRAQTIADEYSRRYPKNTLINSVELPILRAATALHRNHPEQVPQILLPAIRYDRAGAGYSVAYWPSYLRGQAYLSLRNGPDAAVEFQKILDRRGLTPNEILYPLAYLGLARAAVLMGDTAKGRKAYQDFFDLWKDADADIPILIAAKKECERLK